MKKIIGLIASLVFIVNAEAQYSTKKNVENFYAIEVSSAAQVNLFQSDSNYVVLLSKDSIKKTPKLEVRSGVLYVASPYRGKMNVYVKNLTSIKVFDAAKVESRDTLKTNSLNVHVFDAGNAVILVNAKYIKAKANDAGGIALAGYTDSLDVKVSDASYVNSPHLIAGAAKVVSSDGSSATVFARKSVYAKASDGSNIHVKGTPAQKNTSASDGGSVIMDETGEETNPEYGHHSMGSVLEEDSVFGKKKGDRQMIDGFIGGGFITGGNKGAPIKYGNSREFMIGFGGGYKFCKWNGIGFDVYYKSTDFYLAQNSGKNFPDTSKHNAQKVSLQNFGGLLYDRFIFTSGYHGQIALDLGLYGDWTFNTREVSWDMNNDIKTIDRNPSYFNGINYGVTARLVMLRTISIYCNYRLSNAFNTSSFASGQSPTLPAVVFGVNFGLDSGK